MRGYAAIGLHHPKNSINIGSVLRAAAIYKTAMVAISGRRYSKAPTDTMNAWRKLPVIQINDLHDVIPYNCVPVAVDLIESGQSLIDYKHPQQAIYIFGPEDGTLNSTILSWCRDIIYIPTAGCMNLAATVNVVLYDRMAKYGKL